MPDNNITDKIVRIHLARNIYLRIMITSLIFWLLAISLWMQGTLDQRIIIAHNALYENNIISGVFGFLSKYGMALIVAVYILNLLLSYKVKELKSSYHLYILILFSFGLGALTSVFLKELFDRARPAAELAGYIARTHISDSPAFPSGHATKSMALALPYFLLVPKSCLLNRVFRFVVIGIAVLVCYSRILLQAHYVSDVFAGIGTAIAFIPIAAFLSNKIYKAKKVDEKMLERMVIKFGIVMILLAVVLTLM